MVGDADQSIYAFRGATIRNIEEFERDFPNATTILLEQNYRSTQNILSAANAVISHNSSRREKRLWTDEGSGEPIVGYVGDDEHDERLRSSARKSIDLWTMPDTAPVTWPSSIEPMLSRGRLRRSSFGWGCPTR